MLVGLLFIICGTVTFMIIDSSRTIEANVVTNKVMSADSNKNIAFKNTKEAPVAQIKTNIVDSTTGVSAKDQLTALKAQEQITTVASSDSSKTGYSIDYQLNHAGCTSLIELKQEAVDDAESEYEDAKEDYDKATSDLDDLDDDSDAIESAQAEVKDTKEIMDKAEKVLFAAKDDLIKARTTCTD